MKDVARDPGDGRDEKDVDEERDPDTLAQSGPAALVFELADHIQQFVRVVIDPSRRCRTATDTWLLGTVLCLRLPFSRIAAFFAQGKIVIGGGQIEGTGAGPLRSRFRGLLRLVRGGFGFTGRHAGCSCLGCVLPGQLCSGFPSDLFSHFRRFSRTTETAS